MNGALDERTSNAIEASNTDELLRIIDGICASRDWGELSLIRRHCQAALERGKQLWSIDEHARYRLALEAPGSIASAAVLEGPSRFTLGPMPEVAASRHSWQELEASLTAEPERALVAHERVVRGEDLTDATFDQRVLEIPATIQSWEPKYQVAEYHGDRAAFPTPRLPPFQPIDNAAPATRFESESPESNALSGLTSHWIESSNGRVQTVSVEGSAVGAVVALGVPRPGIGQMSADNALAWMAWAAASGAAHGRRRGAAVGRFEAWWTACLITNMEWPPEPAELGEVISELRWFAWTDGSSDGWNLRLAVEDPHDGLAWAISATDAQITDGTVKGQD